MAVLGIIVPADAVTATVTAAITITLNLFIFQFLRDLNCFVYEDTIQALFKGHTVRHGLLRAFFTKDVPKPQT